MTGTFIGSSVVGGGAGGIGRMPHSAFGEVRSGSPALR